ncbi:MAG: alpha/beta hydrolase [Methanobacteriota archaeon]|nr:MAG: alpha/beta hydrolase [Euryarchaeota archaeon]
MEMILLLSLIFGLFVYLIIAGLLFLFFHTNVFIWRSRDYEIPFGKREGKQMRKELRDPRVVYWVCENQIQRKPEDWVILLHSWGRNSGRMIQRAEIYWKLGFSLIFIDARCHGKSSCTWPSNGFTFGYDAIRVADAEGIEQPIVHGLSAGAIAAVYFAKNRPVEALVLEALVSNYRNMVFDTMSFFFLPRKLFAWMAEYLLTLDLPFDDYAPEKVLPQLSCPIFLIHGEKDRFFPPENHYFRNLEALKGKENVWNWLVPGSKHSKMAQHPDYPKKLKVFLSMVSTTKEKAIEAVPKMKLID